MFDLLVRVVTTVLLCSCDPGPHYFQLGLVRMAQWEAGQCRYKLTSLSTASPPIESIFSSASMQKAQESVHRRLATTKHFDLQYSVVLMHAHDNIRTAVILLSPLSRICNCFFLRCLQFSCPFYTVRVGSFGVILIRSWCIKGNR